MKRDLILYQLQQGPWTKLRSAIQHARRNYLLFFMYCNALGFTLMDAK